jgi:hypothetical protein
MPQAKAKVEEAGERKENASGKGGTCLKSVSDQENRVMCELCDKWFHAKCQNTPDSMYKALNQFSKELHWFCSGCKAGAEKLLTVVAKLQFKVDKLEEELARINLELQAEVARMTKEIRDDMTVIRERLAKCETKTEEGTKMTTEKEHLWTSIVAKEVDTQISGVAAEMSSLQQQTKTIIEDREEQQEINRRRNCAIIHGLKEAEGDDIESKKKADGDKIQELLHQIDCDDVSVNAFVRLGKPGTDPNAKPRPTKMMFTSEALKDKVLSHAKNLKTVTKQEFNKVFLHQDLTPRQRQARHLLVQEMKDRQAAGETDLIIVNGRIVKRRF